jgi:hypothetical protein
MKSPRWFSSWLLTAFCSAAFAQLQPGHPLSGIEKLKDFETMRASSSDTNWVNGNADARRIEPGATLTLAELAGPGVVTHIWCTISHSAPFYSRLLTLRIYWDGEEHPSVECPIGDFFGIGHGVDKPFTSIPIRVSSEGRARNCYWPMPFRKSAKITVTNESTERCKAFYFYVDWQKHKSLPADTAYFHAMYRQEYPCVMGRNYLLADIVGRGHYVGTIQSVYSMSAGWYGEGDDFFFIDGETEPRLRGTGTEDYFCDAWGFREQDGPFYGTPLWEGYEAGARSTAYRFHLADPVVFHKSLRAEIEHKGSQKFPDGTSSGFIERDDLMSSVAFWYQLEPHKPWPALPSGPDRLPFREVALVTGEPAVAHAKSSGPPLGAQEAKRLTTDGQYLLFAPADDQGWVEVSFQVGKETQAELYGKFIKLPRGGKYRVRLDGAELGVVDLYAAKIGTDTQTWPARRLAAGEHVLRFECVGKAGASQGYSLGFDALVTRALVYTRPPGFDLRTIQVRK